MIHIRYALRILHGRMNVDIRTEDVVLFVSTEEISRGVVGCPDVIITDSDDAKARLTQQADEMKY